MVEVDLLFFLGLVGGGLAAYAVFKYRLKQVRYAVEELAEALLAVETAVEDDKVTEEEFRLAFGKFKGFFSAIRAIYSG